MGSHTSSHYFRRVYLVAVRLPVVTEVSAGATQTAEEPKKGSSGGRAWAGQVYSEVMLMNLRSGSLFRSRAFDLGVYVGTMSAGLDALDGGCGR